MLGTIVSYRRGRHTQKTNQFLIEAEKVASKADAAKLVGKKVVWKSPAGKAIFGTVTALHGGKGVVRARFNKGLPGEAVGSQIEFK